jgi:hypothetical protein
MVHALTHQRPAKLPCFHLALNLIVGVAWLLPSVMYEKVTLGTTSGPRTGLPPTPSTCRSPAARA